MVVARNSHPERMACLGPSCRSTGYCHFPLFVFHIFRLLSNLRRIIIPTELLHITMAEHCVVIHLANLTATSEVREHLCSVDLLHRRRSSGPIQVKATMSGLHEDGGEENGRANHHVRLRTEREAEQCSTCYRKHFSDLQKNRLRAIFFPWMLDPSCL